VGTIQCREVAAKAGDDYNLRWSMLGDGFATIIAALFGSPFGMTVFIGHPGFKAMGAKLGYNFLCGIAFIIICFSGLAGLFKAIFPPAALNPILLFIGLAICCDALEVTPPRHWPALMLSLCPCFCNWAVTACGNFAAGICNAGCPADDPAACGQNGWCKANPNGQAGWTFDADLRGLYALGQGYLLTSILLTTMLVKGIDHEFGTATIFAVVTAFCASIGLIHSDELFLPWAFPKNSDPYVVEGYYDLHWNFTIAYLLLAATFALLFVLKRAKKLDDPPHLREAQAANQTGSLAEQINRHVFDETDAHSKQNAAVPLVAGA
jgi:AGZA family xanthine/uracil permease-like MFS transporter